MSLDEVLADYDGAVAAWLEQCKKASRAVEALRKAVADGNLRDLEKLRVTARAATDAAVERADNCGPLDFDAGAYLAPGGGFIAELSEAAAKAGVQLFERDGVVFCYPVLLRTEPGASSVRIDKRLVPTLRPPALAAALKKLQARDPKSRPERFIETLLEAYQLERGRQGIATYLDIPLTSIYSVLTLLPGSDKEYTLLDFTRDIYFLDISGIAETRKGYVLSLPASTVTRERKAKLLPFVDRSGHEKLYATLKFTPPAAPPPPGERGS